ncbi:MAG: glycerol-3-phosphate dehydrogenase [Solirubrobacteraceae bacterium]
MAAEAPVAVIGGGVVGAAVTYALARRGVSAVLLEAQDELALAASGTNSGILHTGFDSMPGELETRLIMRAGELRDAVVDELGVPVLRCGAVLRPRVGGGDAATIASLAAAARANGVAVTVRDDRSLHVPGEAVTDPVVYTLALAGAAAAAGADVRTGARVQAIERGGGPLVLRAGDDAVACDLAVNCAGLHADFVARLVGDDSFEIYPRKGEFLVFDSPTGRPLAEILLPVPTKRTKGVLVFPTIDGKVVAGPTAHDQTDKDDWTVRDEGRAEVLAKAAAMLPELEGREPIAAYAGLRPAGRDANYVIGPSPACSQMINVAAIRSTGLTASLGIAEHVVGLLAGQGLELGADRPLAPASGPAPSGPWWRRTAEHRAPA